MASDPGSDTISPPIAVSAVLAFRISSRVTVLAEVSRPGGGGRIHAASVLLWVVTW